MNATVVKKTATTQINRLADRWTKNLIKGGWTGIPNVILERQRTLRLSPIQINLIMQIAKFWWEKEKAPFPSVKLLAKTIDVTPRTIQRHLAELEELGYIEKQTRYLSSGGRNSNAYTFNGLIEKCTKLVEEEEAENKAQEQAKKKRHAIRQPIGPLQIVTN